MLYEGLKYYDIKAKQSLRGQQRLHPCYGSAELCDSPGLCLGCAYLAYSNYMRTVLSEREEQLRLYLSSGAELIADELHTAELKLETVEAVCQEDALRNCAETTSGGRSISGEPWGRQLITAALEGGGSFSLSAEISGSEVVWDCSYSQLNKNITGLPDENDVFSINIKCSSELGEKEKTLSVSLSVSVSSYTIRQQTEEEGGTYNYVYTYREYRYIFV
jgi:hypothetical protein